MSQGAVANLVNHTAKAREITPPGQVKASLLINLTLHAHSDKQTWCTKTVQMIEVRKAIGEQDSNSLMFAGQCLYGMRAVWQSAAPSLLRQSALSPRARCQRTAAPSLLSALRWSCRIPVCNNNNKLGIRLKSFQQDQKTNSIIQQPRTCVGYCLLPIHSAQCVQLCGGSGLEHMRSQGVLFLITVGSASLPT
jgi:hypothetical protein